MPPGRPHRHPDNASRQRAYRQRHAARPSSDAALIQACLTPEDPEESWEAFISRVAFFLSAGERQRDALDWTQAGLIVAAARAALGHPARPKGRAAQIRGRLIKDVRQYWATTRERFHPTPTFLTHALKVADFKPELFADLDPALAQDAGRQTA
jgi:hypothetical protein